MGWYFTSNGGFSVILEHEINGIFQYRGEYPVSSSGAYCIINETYNIDVVVDEWLQSDRFRISCPALGYGYIYFSKPINGSVVYKDIYVRQ